MLFSCKIFVFCQKKYEVYIPKCFSCLFLNREVVVVLCYNRMADFLGGNFMVCRYCSHFVSDMYVMAYLTTLEARELELHLMCCLFLSKYGFCFCQPYVRGVK